jgi:hypothetical protein
MTMHSFGLEKPLIVLDVPNDDTVCFCLGEIDCRCRVHQHQPWRETIDRLVENYLEAIRINTVNHKNVWIFNVVPPARKDRTQENPSFPFLGTDEERLQYVRYMNQKLRESGYVFVDVFDRYVDPEGFLAPELSDGIHIFDPRYIIEWIEKNT